MSSQTVTESAGQRAVPAHVLDVENLCCHIPTPRGLLRAVDDVSFTLAQGQTLGIVGESGSGKSMLMRTVLGIAPASARTGGHVRFDGADVANLPPRENRCLLGRRLALVFQDPMTALNPVVRIGRQLTEGPRHHLGLSRAAAQERALDLLEQVGIPEPRKRLRQYPHQLSGGMRQRVTIAIALSCDPAVLIADEATTALDVTMQKQILDLLGQIQRERHMAMIMVSHDLGVLAGRTDRIAVMYAGRIVEHADTPTLFGRHRHRYTRALLGTLPAPDLPRHALLKIIPGAPPDPVTFAAGCRFAPRCSIAVEQCTRADPPMVSENGSHRHACILPVGEDER